jgi:hypothetical protein
MNCTAFSVASFLYTQTVFLDFKISSCCECFILSFGWFPFVWILFSCVSEHSVCYVFVGRSCSRDLRIWNTQSVPERRHIKFRSRGITQKKEQEKIFLFLQFMTLWFMILWFMILWFISSFVALTTLLFLALFFS